MNRREFLATTGNIGLTAALGIPNFHDKIVVDVTLRWAACETAKFQDYILFADVERNRLGVQKDGNRMEIPLDVARFVVSSPSPCIHMDVRLEYSAREGWHDFGDPALLYANRIADEFGIKPKNMFPGSISVPYSAALRLLEKIG